MPNKNSWLFEKKSPRMVAARPKAKARPPLIRLTCELERCRSMDYMQSESWRVCRAHWPLVFKVTPWPGA